MATTPNDLTRQQLDDLDALLQRMLTAPAAAAPAKAPPVSAPTTTRFDPPASAPREPHIAVNVMPAPEPPVILESRIDARAYFKPEIQDPVSRVTAEPTPPRLFGMADPMPPVVEQRSVNVPSYETPLDPEPNITVEPPVVAFQQAMELPNPYVNQDSTIPLTVAPTPLPDMPMFASSNQVPMWAWPVYGVNSAIEGVLKLFGPPGELLTTGPVKWLLGLSGIALIGVAAVWTARGMGWIQW